MDIMTQKKLEAVEALQKLANDWIAADSKRTKTSLARATEVSEATIRRLLNDNVLPSNETLFKFQVFFKNSKTVNEITSSTSDAVATLLSFQMPYLQFEENKTALLWTSLASKLDSQYKKIIFLKMSVVKTLSMQNLKDDFGSLGLVEAQSLVSDKILNFSHDSFSINPEFAHSFADAKSVHEIIEIANKLYYKHDLNINYSYLVAEGISKSGYSQVMDVLEDAHKKISAIAKQYPGDIPLIATGFMDTLTTESVFGEGGGHE